MDIQKTAKEIGVFETAINLSFVSESPEVTQKISDSFPLPSTDITERTKRIAEWLLSFGKNKYMFLSPEIAVIEEMAKAATRPLEMIITVPCDMDEDAKTRLANNLPIRVTTTILEEPYFPTGFFPGNGMMVVSGYAAGGRTMIFPDTYRLIEHYSGFWGKKAFIPYTEISTSARYDGWMALNQQRVDITWRSNYD